MPTVRKTAPLLPEGEYCGQARLVRQEWSKAKVNPDGSKSEPYPLFRIPLHIPGGQVITAVARVMASTAWQIENLCKSGDLIPPEEMEFVLNSDDLERRVFYFGVKHEEYNGQKKLDIKFHTKNYAISVNPNLENIMFPNAAPRGVALRAANPSPEPPPAEPPQAPAVPKDPVGPSGGTHASQMEGLNSLSDDDFASAIEYAKRLKAQKEEAGK